MGANKFFFSQFGKKSLVFYDRFNNSNFNEIDNLIPITSNITFQTRIGGFTGVFNGQTSLTYQNKDYFSFTNDLKDLPFTIGGYIRIDNVSGNKFILSKRQADGNGNEYQFFILGNKLIFDFFDNQLGGVLRSISAPIQINTDYCFVFTYDGNGTTNGVSIHINGVLSTESVEIIDNYGLMRKTSANFTIGKRSFGQALYFNGNIDNLFVFNYVIDSLQIADITTKVLNNNDIR